MVIELLNPVPVMGRKLESPDPSRQRLEVLPGEAKRLIANGDAVAIPWDLPGNKPRQGVNAVVGSLPFSVGR